MLQQTTGVATASGCTIRPKQPDQATQNAKRPPVTWASMCGRTLRSANRTVTTPTQVTLTKVNKASANPTKADLIPTRTTIDSAGRCGHSTSAPPAQAAVKPNALAKCAICDLEVSPEKPTVLCRLCGVHVHTACDEALNAMTIELLIGDNNPAVCYQCTQCRPKSVVAVRPGKSVLEERVVAVEAQIHRIQQQLQLGASGSVNYFEQDRDGNVSVPETRLPSENRAPNPGEITLTATEPNLHERSEQPRRRSPKLSFICTNVPEARETLLHSIYQHDQAEWSKLCDRLGLAYIKPVSLLRLRRDQRSPHNNNPRMLKITVSTEAELEDILLSAHLLRDGEDSTSRIYPDLPWWERRPGASPEKRNNLTDNRSLVLMGIPEAADTTAKNQVLTHDSQQWKFIEDQMGLKNCVVVDTFRIPKSSKYMGSGPCPLKLTFLTNAMATEVQDRWNNLKHLLPTGIRLQYRKSNEPRNTENKVSQLFPTRPADTAISTPDAIDELASVGQDFQKTRLSRSVLDRLPPNCKFPFIV